MVLRIKLGVYYMRTRKSNLFETPTGFFRALLNNITVFIWGEGEVIFGPYLAVRKVLYWFSAWGLLLVVHRGLCSMGDRTGVINVQGKCFNPWSISPPL